MKRPHMDRGTKNKFGKLVDNLVWNGQSEDDVSCLLEPHSESCQDYFSLCGQSPKRQASGASLSCLLSGPDGPLGGSGDVIVDGDGGDGGGLGSGSGGQQQLGPTKTVTFASGLPSPTCTANCGQICTGYWCMTEEERRGRQPAHYTDPASVSDKPTPTPTPTSTPELRFPCLFIRVYYRPYQQEDMKYMAVVQKYNRDGSNRSVFCKAFIEEGIWIANCNKNDPRFMFRFDMWAYGGWSEDGKGSVQYGDQVEEVRMPMQPEGTGPDDTWFSPYGQDGCPADEPDCERWVFLGVTDEDACREWVGVVWS